MTGFSVTAAAFSGLRMFRAKPMVFAAWFVFALIVTFASWALAALTMGPAMAELNAAQAGAAANPQAVLAASGKALLRVLYMTPVYLLIVAVTMAAASRAILRPAEDRLGFLRLGMDELRLAATVTVIGLVLFGVYFVGAMVFGIIGAIVAGTTGLLTQNPAAGAGVVLLFLLPLLVILFVLWAKLSLAPAQTVDTGQIRIFDSWSLTKGITGKICLTYLLSIAVYIGAYLVALAVMLGGSVALGHGASGLMRILQPDFTSVKALMTPDMAIYLMITSLLAAFSAALFYCPAAYIYSQVRKGAVEDVF